MKTKLFLFMLLLCKISFAQIPTTGLNSYYEFTNGSFNDTTINANHFTQSGTALTTTNSRFGVSNTAISLNGDDLTRGDIEYPSSGTDLDLGAVSFWIKTTTNDSDIKTIIDDSIGRSNVSDTEWGGYYFYLRDGKVGVSGRMLYNSSYKGVGVLGTNVISDGGWHHVVANLRTNVYFTGASDIASIYVTLYVDGVSQGSSSAAESRIFNAPGGSSFGYSLDTSGDITIGNNRSNSLPIENKYQDELDDLIFYTRNLTATEVTQLATYNSFCFTDVSAITLSNTTENSVEVSLPTSTTYDLAYHKKNEPFSNATVLSNITSGSQIITGLSSSSQYVVYIRENCTSTLKSSWSTSVNFKTKGVLYVNTNATGNNDGSSWANAFIDLQSALAIYENEDEIWIASGTYSPGSDRLDSFNFNKNNTKIYGGFSGVETDVNQRDLSVNKTILSGDVNNDDTGVAFSGVNRTDNNYQVAKITTTSIIIDGIHFENGHANNTTSNSTEAYGAGLLLSSATTSTSLKNCEFNNNVSYSGGAVRAYYDFISTLDVDNCKFNNNLSRYGSGLYVLVKAYKQVDVNISNTLFTNNVSKDYSTTYKGYTGSSVWLRANTTSSNVTSKIINCTFSGNQDIGNAVSERGTIALGRNVSGTHNAEVSNTIIWGNTGVISNTASINFGHTTAPNSVLVNNSIGEDNFTNITTLIASSNSDPLFTDTVNNDFTLAVGSPAIDSGDNSKVLPSIVTDLLGNSRFFNTTVDMGVYEFGASTPANYTLTTNATNGTVTNDPTGTSFIASTSVDLTATPDAGYQFDSWSGDATGTTNPLTIRMDADKNITAVFVVAKQTLAITAINGSVITDPNPVNGTYDYGATVSLTAVPDAGYIFNGWTEDVLDTNISTTLIMDSDKTVTANFIQGPTYVDVDATGNNDGTSWADAYTDLQTAITNTAVEKDIWVAKGTYTPTGTGRTATFLMNKKQKIYGGFQGDEISLVERDMNVLHTTNATILSGDLNGDDNASILENEATRQDNAYHVVTVKGNFGTGGELNGFTVTGGNSNGSLSNSCSTASASQYDRRLGAAIFENPDGLNYQVHIKVSNSIIEKNTGSYYAVFGRFSPCGETGTQSHVDFESVIIRNNYTRSSANIAFSGSQRYYIKTFGSIVNSLITNNVTGATDKSSALFINSSSATGYTTPAAIVDVINSTIVNNSSTTTNAITINLGAASSYPVNFYNSIVYNNGGTTSISVLGTNGGSATFANNIIEGGHYSSSSLDPMLNNEYKLLTGSPAIDAGDNTKLIDITKDLAGADRFQNTTVDLGAYEGDVLPVNYTLSTNAINGSITSNPMGNSFASGTVVILTATPDAGYQFDGWSGDAGGIANPLSITMDANKSVTALFIPVQQTLATTATNGMITADIAPTNGTYDVGTVLELTATPDTGYQFDGWSGDASGTTNPLSVTMDADKNITALFSQIQRTLAVTAINGTVVLANGTSPNGTFADGTAISLMATADVGYQFDGWSGDASGTTNPLSVTMDADKNIVAMFSLIPTASVVDNEFSLGVRAYPNPIKNTLKIELSKGQMLKKTQVFNLLGKKVMETDNNTMDFSAVSSGIYLLKIENTEGKIAMRKVIKE